MSRFTISSLLAVLCAAPLAAQMPPVIQSTFDAGVDGWTHIGGSVFKHEPTGGHPGGFLYIDNSEGPVTWIVGPAKFEGDLTAYIGGTLSFDGIMLGTGGAPWGPNPQDYGNAWVGGPGGWAHGDLSPYNVLLHEERLVIIDWPQIVDVIGNPQGFDFLERDATTMATWFVRKGLDGDPGELVGELVAEATSRV
jgi:hypothetical protein